MQLHSKSCLLCHPSTNPVKLLRSVPPTLVLTEIPPRLLTYRHVWMCTSWHTHSYTPTQTTGFRTCQGLSSLPACRIRSPPSVGQQCPTLPSLKHVQPCLLPPLHTPASINNTSTPPPPSHHLSHAGCKAAKHACEEVPRLPLRPHIPLTHLPQTKRQVLPLAWGPCG